MRRRTDKRAGRREKHVKGRRKAREAQKRWRSKVGGGRQGEEEEGREDMLKEKEQDKMCEKRRGRYRGEVGVRGRV